MNMQELDEKLRETEVKKRREFLIKQLYGLGITHTTDGRKLEECRLFTLERVYINERIIAARAYGE